MKILNHKLPENDKQAKVFLIHLLLININKQMLEGQG